MGDDEKRRGRVSAERLEIGAAEQPPAGGPRFVTRTSDARENRTLSMGLPSSYVAMLSL
jgi:hypothetical protein